MTNPWKTIPLDDYEGHMALPAIGQAEMLSGEFSRLLHDHASSAVALVGCAGGNGFAEAANLGVDRFVGIDINPHYIAAAARRFSSDFASLELHCADIEGDMPAIVGVDLIFAALVFEYVDVPKAMTNIARLCRRDAILGALIQLPSHAAAISASPYSSLHNLGSIMRLVSPEELRDAAQTAGFVFMAERTIELPSGKSFAHQIFSAKG